MMSFMGQFFPGDFLPKRFAGVPIETHHNELISFSGRFGAHSATAARSSFSRATTATATGTACRCRSCGLVLLFLAGRNGAEKKNAVTPHDRSGSAKTGRFHF